MHLICRLNDMHFYIELAGHTPKNILDMGAARGGSRALLLSAGTGQLATFETHFHFAIGDTVVVPNTIRFMKQAEVAAFLAAAGFTEASWYDDWDRSSIGSRSPEIIVIAQR